MRFSSTLVEVHTSEGLIGYGSGDAMLGFDEFKHLFIGKEVSQMERHSDVLTALAFHYARYWPLEIALWDVLGKAARLPQFSGEAAVGVVDEIGDRGRDVVKVATPPVGIVRMAPTAIIEHHPER